MSANVLITNQAPIEHFSALEGIATLRFADHSELLMPREQVMERAKDVEAIINQGELRVDEELLVAAPKLKIVANVAIGTDNLNAMVMEKHGVWATNAPDAFTESTADCTMALLLAVTRNIVAGDRYVRGRTWAADGYRPVRWEGPLLSGKTLGLVGYGNIGKAVEKRAQAFGMKVIHTRSKPDADHPDCRSLDDLLSQSDIVSLHTPLTKRTKHLIDGEAMTLMKSGAYLVNLARGPVVDEEKLVVALKSGKLAGAGLDVFEREPEVHAELLSLPQVVLAPHLGGAAHEARQAARALAAENVRLVLSGQKPVTAINRVKG